MRILIATRNPAKFREMSDFLKSAGHDCVSLNDLQINENAVEDGQTFEENALKKARFFCSLSKLPTLSDDGGLAIDALNGEPGVYSRRWNGTEMSDEELLNYTLEKMKDIPPENRAAHLIATIALVFPDGREIVKSASVDGVIFEKQLIPIDKGYPFRSIFVISELNKAYGALTTEEHDRLNQRIAALKLIASEIK